MFLSASPPYRRVRASRSCARRLQDSQLTAADKELIAAWATQKHVDAIFAEGRTQRDLHDAILTVCLFNFMNRLLEGHGVKGSPAVCAQRGQALHNGGYAPLLGLLADPAPQKVVH